MTDTRGGRREQESEPGDRHPTFLVTVITVVYNGASGLAQTVDSVLALPDEDIEYVVVDGGSTDGTQDILRAYGNRLDYWLSEPDAGIYDAMNKAIALARGRFVLHLNIGDRLLAIPRVLKDGVADDVVC